jgi:hypothetical protein
VDVRPAGEVVPGYHRNLITHAGTAIGLDEMQPKFRDGVLCAALIEGLAESFDDAAQLIRSGEIELEPAWDYNIPIAGMAAVSYSMPVMVAEDKAHGTFGFSPIMEGPSEALRSLVTTGCAGALALVPEGLSGRLKYAYNGSVGCSSRNIISRSLAMGMSCTAGKWRLH